jgi:acylphosphatase
MGKILQIDVFGKVQGVWFRKYTKQKAEELEIKGNVQNMPDGFVRIHASAEAPQLKSFLDWCERFA